MAKSLKIKKLFIFFLILFVLLIGLKTAHENNILSLNFIDKFRNNTSVPVISSTGFNGKLETAIINTLSEFEVRNNELESSFFLEDKERVITAVIPKGRPIELVVLKFQRCAKGTNYSVHDSYQSSSKGSCSIVYKSKKKDHEDIRLNIKIADRYLSNASKIAFLIENFEFNADQTTIEYLSFDAPLTFSLKPSKTKSEWTAKAAAEYNKEIVIILPMELKYGNSKGTRLMIHYSDERLIETINSFSEMIPNFSGFTALSPSPVLEDSRVMNTILRQIKRRYGYFIWPHKLRTPSITKAIKDVEIASSPIEKRITTDNEKEVESQLRHCIIISQKRSSLLVSAKSSAVFIKKLKELSPLLKQNGIQIVPVSQIVEQY